MHYVLLRADEEEKRAQSGRPPKDLQGKTMTWIDGRGWSKKDGWAHQLDKEAASGRPPKDNYGKTMVWIEVNVLLFYTVLMKCEGRGWSVKGGRADKIEKRVIKFFIHLITLKMFRTLKNSIIVPQ